MDGVLCDFAGPAGKFWKKDFSGWVEVTDEDWLDLKRQWPTFWMDLEPLPHARDLWKTLLPFKPHILTSCPPVWPTAAIGKEIWCKEHLPKFEETMFHSVLGSEHKKKFANSQSMLIDDLLPSITDWKSAGGKAVHYTPSAAMINTVRVTLKGL